MEINIVGLCERERERERERIWVNPEGHRVMLSVDEDESKYIIKEP